MTLTKSILLGSAAALLAVAGAHAADLPSKKAAPAQYVKICDAAGAGYFYIPGSDTCLKISGYAELDLVSRTTKATYSESGLNTATAASRNNNTFSTDTEIQLDAITKTSYGDVHTYLAYEITTPTNAAYIDNAYFEFAGLTAGKHESFYHNIGGLYSGYQTPDYSTNLLAYTASFGGGFSASLSLEDSLVSRYQAVLTGNGVEYNGSRVPDVIGALRVKQGWGEASLIGGMHETRINDYWNADKTVNGYGVMGFVKFNLPMIAAGDTIAFQAAYERNALKFAGLGGSAYNGFQNVTPDFYSGWHIHNQTGYSLLADFVHNWTATVSTEVEASYGQVRYEGPMLSEASEDINGYKEFRIGQVTKWKPVKGLEFGIDTAYTRYTYDWNAHNVLENYVGGAQSDFRVQFRAIRSF